MHLDKKSIGFAAGILFLLAAGSQLLGGDFPAFFKWYFVILVLGVGFFTLTSRLFADFSDGGWMFSKVIGIAVSGFVIWLLACAKLVQFTSRRSWIVTLILIGITTAFFIRKQKSSRKYNIALIFAEEFLFLAAFLLWTYVCGFRPAAHGTEKFMDYGFMAAMARSTYMPAGDMWFAGEGLNYYYGGQFYGVYLLKLAYVSVEQAYNLFRMMIAGFAFVLPFTLVFHMLEARFCKRKNGKVIASLGGILAGVTVSLAGNMHYVLYGLFGSVFKLSGYENYWFPSSTRYIGHNPMNDDQCIHEFPSYSFVLGDVHAHMINVMFVLTVLGILYAWVRAVRKEEKGTGFIRRNLTDWAMVLAAFFVGLFHWTNYWDFIIYYTVTLFCIVSVSFYRYGNHPKRAVLAMVLHIAELTAVQTLAALPFTLQFETMMQGIGIAKHHTAFYQLLVLWGLPMAVFLFFTGEVLADHVKKNRGYKENLFLTFFRMVPQPDRFAVILGICGFGLILIPELVYVRDIYEEGYARSNTMFKLTYQAYIMFGIFMAYALVRLLAKGKNPVKKIVAAVLLFCVGLTVGYLPYSVKEWFGNITDHSGYQGLNATAFLEAEFSEDASAIRWLNENVSGQPVILESYGDSYSDDCRVSAMTGLPTVEGWYVHEWLWRSDTGELNQRRADIDAVYDGASYLEQYTEGGAENLTFEKRAAAVKTIVNKYQIEYIFVGTSERKWYPEMNEDVLQSLGTIVYQEGSTYIIQVAEN
ncbi:MAG: DUF2298 domain-containing protein [Eubacteriales bacterium]|nr:DUF2298 domain-containing protein [Eubacteriales bacterium]